jgi:glycosyltransferase involved in cell wall biosynthesis
MRLAIVSSWFTDVISGSGTAVFWHAFVDGLRSRGHHLDIISPSFTTKDYVEVTLQRFLFNAELRTDPRIQQADAVIGFDYDGYALDTLHSPPLITSAHAVFGDIVQWESEPARTMVQSQAFFDQVAMRKAQHVTIGSQYAKDRIVALYGIAPDKVTVIPHGMLTPTWMRYMDAEPRHENDHPVILSVGKMYPRKRTNILLKAVAVLREKYPSIELRVVGDGLEWERLHALADQLQLGRNVTWLGHIADDRTFAREWRQADVFAHPSNQETFGYVYLEAMQLGKPIVAAYAGAAPEVVGEAGLLVPPENPLALAAALDQMLSSQALRERYGVLGKERARLYTHERMVNGYVSVIERVIQDSQRRVYRWLPSDTAAD